MTAAAVAAVAAVAVAAAAGRQEEWQLGWVRVRVLERNWSERLGRAQGGQRRAIYKTDIAASQRDGNGREVVRLPSLPFATRRDSLVQPLAPCGKARTYIRGAASLDAWAA